MDRLTKAKEELEKATEEFLFAVREAGLGRAAALQEVKIVIADAAAAIPE